MKRAGLVAIIAPPRQARQARTVVDDFETAYTDYAKRVRKWLPYGLVCARVKPSDAGKNTRRRF